MVTGETKSGFAFSLDDNTMDNMELVDALAEMQSTNPLAVSRVVHMVLGSDQKRRLYDHVRGEDGRVSVKAVEQEIEEIFAAFDTAGKNS